MTSATPTAEAKIWFLDNLAQVHVSGEETGGAYGLVAMRGRSGDMPPLHVHRRDDELFYVIDGRVVLHLPERTIVLGPGESFLAPKNVPHAYRIDSDEATWLVAFSPAGFERFVEEVGSPAEGDTLPPPGRPHDPEALAAGAARYGIEILGPPGTLPGD
ncbi:MAG: quercetin 2,3-dioxygenase [Actinobacteria bacterium]|nr:quercetin 2,3-dioxygenase [Actinomycetota bacterium]